MSRGGAALDITPLRRTSPAPLGGCGGREGGFAAPYQNGNMGEGRRPHTPAVTQARSSTNAKNMENVHIETVLPVSRCRIALC